jgi:Zn-dependent oligopeptidase
MKNKKMKKGKKKIAKVMSEFSKKMLHAGSEKGPIVTKPAQAKAIALSEARKAGAKIPKKKRK